MSDASDARRKVERLLRYNPWWCVTQGSGGQRLITLYRRDASGWYAVRTWACWVACLSFILDQDQRVGKGVV